MLDDTDDGAIVHRFCFDILNKLRYNTQHNTFSTIISALYFSFYFSTFILRFFAMMKVVVVVDVDFRFKYPLRLDTLQITLHNRYFKVHRGVGPHINHFVRIETSSWSINTT